MGEFKFEIKRHIRTLSTNERGLHKELNIISWNDMPEKLDIRDWYHGHERMTRGVTLTIEEAIRLKNALSEYLSEVQGQ